MATYTQIDKDQYCAVLETTQKGVTFKIRLSFAEADTLQSCDAEIDKISQWKNLAWQKISLVDGTVLTGQAYVQGSENSLLDLAKAGLTDVNVGILEAAIAASQKLRQAEKEYRDSILGLGAVSQESGSYEDYDSWYSLDHLNVPGKW
jgi:hypothetical protein